MSKLIGVGFTLTRHEGYFCLPGDKEWTAVLPITVANLFLGGPQSTPKRVEFRIDCRWRPGAMEFRCYDRHVDDDILIDPKDRVDCSHIPEPGDKRGMGYFFAGQLSRALERTILQLMAGRGKARLWFSIKRL